MLLLQPPVLAAATAGGAAWYVWSCLASPLWKVPGPWYSAFTSLVLRYRELRAERTTYIHQLHLQYGPAVRISPNEVAFASVESIKEIYASGGNQFYDLFMVYGRRTMFSTLVKDDHAKRKRILADRYANTNVQRAAAIDGIHERAGRFLDRCTASVGKSIDIFVSILINLHNYAFDCVSHHLFHPYGSDSLRNPQDEEIQKQVTFDDSLQNRLIKHHYPTIHRAMGSVIALFASPRETPLADELVLSAASRSDPARFTVVNRMQEKAHGLDQTTIAAECLDHMAAGIDTTGDALCFLMWELSQPRSMAVQRRLQQELRENKSRLVSPGESGGGAEQQQQQPKRFDELPYLDAVVMEGLRCFPAIPMSLPRYVPRGGRTIDGYFVPGGAVVSCQAYSTHRIDQDVFPEPEVFRPERWFAGEHEMERKKLFFAFANGGRGCIGKHLALAEMKILLQEIYSRFTTLPDYTCMSDEDMAMADQIISSQPRAKKCLLTMVPIDVE
ncbi:cytochrome P450 [Microdochium trichocladiopsis]|uniref:Cytochrome P450 n=1 Tax=Microdochium trichocladiopsis TaxID=1682393 RepID=A0A9P8YIR7_9PEZI|nr:cytochrome P450 [Microdochium trichocladiopsis]KAH7041030.1 cytochrome P450 [Microdochium trichocladiopsis]